jgi:hypothetical protein
MESLQDRIQNLVNEYREQNHSGGNSYISEPSWSSPQEIEAYIRSPASLACSPPPPPPPPPPGPPSSPPHSALLPVTISEEVVQQGIKGKRTRGGGGGLVEDTKRKRGSTGKVTSRAGNSTGQEGSASNSEVVIASSSSKSQEKPSEVSQVNRLIEGASRQSLFNHLVSVGERQHTQAEKLYKLSIGFVIYLIYYLFIIR